MSSFIVLNSYKYILLLKYAVFIESNKNTHIFTINYHENA